MRRVVLLAPVRLVEDFFVRIHDLVVRDLEVRVLVVRVRDVRYVRFVVRVPAFFVRYVRVLVLRVLAIDHNLRLRVMRFLRHGTVRRRNNQLIVMIGRWAGNL